MASALFPGNSAYRLDVTPSLSGNTLTVTLSVTKTSGSGFWTSDAQPWAINIDGTIWTGTWTYDFRASTPQTIVIAARAKTLSPGSRGYAAEARMASGIGQASAGGSVFIATVPPAPNINCQPPNPSLITTTSMRVTFCSTGDGGSPITSWALQRATDAAFTQNVVTIGSSGTSDITGLAPGTRYYYRARGQNAVGVGAWSATVSATTLPAVPPGMTVTPTLSGFSATVALTPPGGISGVTGYEVERRIGTGAATTVTGSSPIVVNGLTPGTTYQWRARALFGTTAQSPWTDWVSLTQPNPSTSPGNYFDGSTAATSSVTYSWTGAVNNSASVARSPHVEGWAAPTNAYGFMPCVRVAGGRSGAYAARAIFTRDITTFLAYIGQNAAEQHAAEVAGGGTYWGSIFVWPSRAQAMTVEIVWFNAAFAEVGSRPAAATTVVPPGGWTRLVVSAQAPADAAFAIARARDVRGAVGHSNWLTGEWLMADAAMVSLSLYDYFDGSTPDSPQFTYEWVETPNASPSRRLPRELDYIDPLEDPDCPAPPRAPRPPQIEDDCLVGVGLWRRYIYTISAGDVTRWLYVIPTLTIATGAAVAREVRIRWWSNPQGVAASEYDWIEWESEQLIRYLPANTDIVIDGLSERAHASVNGGGTIPADQLLMGTGGGPATWPMLECGEGYFLTIDTPLDSPLGNISASLDFTQAMG